MKTFYITIVLIVSSASFADHVTTNSKSKLSNQVSNDRTEQVKKKLSPNERLRIELHKVVSAGKFKFHLIDGLWKLKIDRKKAGEEDRAADKIIEVAKHLKSLMKENLFDSSFEDCIVTIGAQYKGPSVSCHISIDWQTDLKQLREFFKKARAKEPQKIRREAQEIANELVQAGGTEISFDESLTLEELKRAKPKLLKLLSSPVIENKGILSVSLFHHDQRPPRKSSVSGDSLTLNLASNDWNPVLDNHKDGPVHSVKMAKGIVEFLNSKKPKNTSEEKLLKQQRAYLENQIKHEQPKVEKEQEKRRVTRARYGLRKFLGVNGSVSGYGLTGKQLESYLRMWKTASPDQLAKLKAHGFSYLSLHSSDQEVPFITTSGLFQVPVNASVAEVLKALPTPKAYQAKKREFEQLAAVMRKRLKIFGSDKEGSVTFYAHRMSHQEGIDGMKALKTILDQGYRLKPPIDVVHFYKSKKKLISYWNNGRQPHTQVLMSIGIDLNKLDADKRNQFFERVGGAGLRFGSFKQMGNSRPSVSAKPSSNPSKAASSKNAGGVPGVRAFPPGAAPFSKGKSGR